MHRGQTDHLRESPPVLTVLDQAEAELRRTARRFSLCADDACQRAVEILLTKAPDRPPPALVPGCR